MEIAWRRPDDVFWRQVVGGSAVYRLSSSDSKGGKLVKLDNTVVVFEYEIDANGSYHGKGWQWK